MKEPETPVQDLMEGDDEGLIRKRLFSPSLRAALDASEVSEQPKRYSLDESIRRRSLENMKSGNFSGYSSSRWSVFGFLAAVARSDGVTGNGAASIFNRQNEFVTGKEQEDFSRYTWARARGTQEMAELLRGAIELRSATGGKDAYIGLRHVLIGALLGEVDGFDSLRKMAEGGTDPMVLAQSIADFCLKDMEPGEDPDVWQEFIDEALPSALALDIRPRRAEEVATPGNDDPWAGDVIDRSGATLEAEAFASMICWRDLDPPLAVGVFGNWGTGKSFFMRLVHDAIERRCVAAQKTQDGDTEERFLDHVVQIRFNAWHYAETNLWASLVDHILTKLDAWAKAHSQGDTSDRMFEQLDSARDWTLSAAQDLVERRRAKREAEAELSTAQAALEHKQEQIADDPKLWMKAAWDEVLESDVTPAAKKAARDLGLSQELPEGVDDMRKAMELYTADKGPQSSRAWLHFIGSRPLWGIALVAGILLLPIVLTAALAGTATSPAAGIVAGIIAPAVLFLSSVTRGLRKAHGHLSAVHVKVKEAMARESAKQQRAQDLARAELEAARQAEASAVEKLREKEAALDAARLEYLSQEGKGRILKFVRDRVSAGDYRRQLSFIAEIRRDFDELSLLMSRKSPPHGSEERRKQHETRVKDLIAAAQKEGLLEGPEEERLRATYAPLEAGAEPPVFERIVLYIDDLDRCPADQVVMVLQAIHLLLAYPLFVVFVAVDVRWLQAALAQAYPQFLDEDETATAAGTATPGDYLEKIFQIPYWVRPMTATNTQDLLSDLMRGGPLREPESDLDASVQMAEPAPDVETPHAPLETETETPTTHEPAQTSDPLAPVRLEFSDEEREFVKALAGGLDGSPRRSLRFVSSYRLIKASLPPGQRKKMLQSGYKPVLALLALQVGQIDQIDGLDPFQAVTRQIATAPMELLNWAGQLEASAGRERLLHVLRTFEDAEGDWADLAEYSGLVARFSFVTDRA
ncbi:hypothetical protein ROLI_018140 [Roseobacter fucihabitans]|uniref:KAP NTPase domain-containing protein n=1 Tax=Roseobacter fucihabitans TaxID=1537242 RepID=A0ABZ2BSQ0_9RHOB|nr:P-loop NTPase fold protein [Roseobacter litoralis]MBC6965573.1 KAP family P-loop domain protein [Roseobacter litoralis]